MLLIIVDLTDCWDLLGYRGRDFMLDNSSAEQQWVKLKAIEEQSKIHSRFCNDDLAKPRMSFWPVPDFQSMWEKLQLIQRVVRDKLWFCSKHELKFHFVVFISQSLSLAWPRRGIPARVSYHRSSNLSHESCTLTTIVVQVLSCDPKKIHRYSWTVLYLFLSFSCRLTSAVSMGCSQLNWPWSLCSKYR